MPGAGEGEVRVTYREWGRGVSRGTSEACSQKELETDAKQQTKSSLKGESKTNGPICTPTTLAHAGEARF